MSHDRSVGVRDALAMGQTRARCAPYACYMVGRSGLHISSVVYDAYTSLTITEFANSVGGRARAQRVTTSATAGARMPRSKPERAKFSPTTRAFDGD